jgi:hypothetical protein
MLDKVAFGDAELLQQRNSGASGKFFDQLERQ